MRLRRLFCLAIALLITQAAHADGAFFKQSATEAPPPIPRQQALISFRDGVETLLVESTVENDGSELAWIIPVPAKPTRYEAVEPGLLETLRVHTQTPVEDTWDSQSAFLYAAMLAIAILVSFVIIPRGYLGYGRPWIVLLLIPFICFFALTRGLDKTKGLRVAAGGTTINGVTLLEGRQVGDYDVSLLNLTGTAGLQNWLDSEGFGKMPDNAAAIINEYIAEKWPFVAARLRPQEDGTLRPHPIALSFPTEEAIYPMRLTRVANVPTFVELYVAADKQALPWKRSLQLYWSSLIKPSTFHYDPCDFSTERSAATHPTTEYQMNGLISHSKAHLFFGEGAVVTKLAGTFNPAAMAEDVRLTFGPHIPFIRKAITKEVAVSITRSRSLLALLAAAFLADCLFWLAKKRRALQYLAFVILPAITVAAGAAGITVLTLPPVAIATTSNHRNLDNWYGVNWDAITEDLRNLHPETWNDTSMLRQYIQDFVVKHNVINPYQGGLMHEERSPGNYTLETTDCGNYLRFFAPESVSSHPDQDRLVVEKMERAIARQQRIAELLEQYFTPAGATDAFSPNLYQIHEVQFAENSTPSQQHIYCRFSIPQYEWDARIDEWKAHGLVETTPNTRLPREFTELARAIDDESSEIVTLPWWSTRPAEGGGIVTVVPGTRPPQYYTWPLDPTKSRAVVSVMVVRAEHDTVTVYGYVYVPE